ncbi:MAG: hypothetical protein ACETWM_20425 [Candidatus Lokiarchaeia archaeon]
MSQHAMIVGELKSPTYPTQRCRSNTYLSGQGFAGVIILWEG